jgi:acyl-coenzyme A synthetase/AMP-(fatty) acid ligase
VKIAGHRVSPQEVEHVIARLPGIEDAAACGLPDALHGEVLAAAVMLSPGAALTPEVIRRHCIERLPSYKVPTSVLVVKGLPRTNNGKIDRRRLPSCFTRPEPSVVVDR